MALLVELNFCDEDWYDLLRSLWQDYKFSFESLQSLQIFKIFQRAWNFIDFWIELVL